MKCAAECFKRPMQHSPKPIYCTKFRHGTKRSVWHRNKFVYRSVFLTCCLSEMQFVDSQNVFNWRSLLDFKIIKYRKNQSRITARGLRHSMCCTHKHETSVTGMCDMMLWICKQALCCRLIVHYILCCLMLEHTGEYSAFVDIFCWRLCT